MIEIYYKVVVRLNARFLHIMCLRPKLTFPITIALRERDLAAEAAAITVITDESEPAVTTDAETEAAVETEAGEATETTETGATVTKEPESEAAP
jgi:hypothetical protein